MKDLNSVYRFSTTNTVTLVQPFAACATDGDFPTDRHGAPADVLVPTRPALARRPEFTGKPSHAVGFHGIHCHRDLFGSTASRALECAIFDAGACRAKRAPAPSGACTADTSADRLSCP